MDYRWIDSGVDAAQNLMDRDALLLEELDPAGPLVVHVYDWAGPSATIGCLADASSLLHSQEGLHLARRPTGGGLIFHLFDWAFSILIPDQHPWKQSQRIQNYRWINHHMAEVLKRLFGDPLTFLSSGHHGKPTFCMVQGTQYDGIIGSTKALGAAQRQKQQGILHQGSVSLALPCTKQLSRWVKEDIGNQMETYAYAPLGQDYDRLPATRIQLKETLRAYMEEIT